MLPCKSSVRKLCISFITALITTGACLAQPDATSGRQSIIGEPALQRTQGPAPETRISGLPGSISITDRTCRNFDEQQVRRLIVHLAVQEWSYFGHLLDDQRQSAAEQTPGSRQPWRLGLYASEVAQVAGTVAGYWAAAPDSGWILARQNEAWQKPQGLGQRWRDPWSAAFISWVMCESGLGEDERFQRAVAHHTYIDQAIAAADNGDSTAAYHAFNPGDRDIVPGDLLCSGLRPRYLNLQERRQQAGQGARTHCDIVVRTDSQQKLILAIGGNVRASVRMKVFPAIADEHTGKLVPRPSRRTVFAHLSLQYPLPDEALLDSAPVLRLSACNMPAAPVTLAELNITAGAEQAC